MGSSVARMRQTDSTSSVARMRQTDSTSSVARMRQTDSTSSVARVGKKVVLSRMTQVDEWAPLVLEKLTITLGDDAPKLIALLKDTGAILSGGFVLNSIAKYYVAGSGPAPDLDIYVPLPNMPRFLGALVNDTLKFKMFTDPYDATIYCRSFLRKNGIRRVYTFLTTNDKSVDVMAVRTKKTVQDVCSNFDLTFCQVWFDGTNVFATHPDHIREKKGYLQGEYIDTFVQSNAFLKDRIRKYQSRGFKVEYDPSVPSVKLPVIADVLQNRGKCSKEEAREVLLPVWFQRAATRWLALSKENRKKFVLPFGKKTRNQVFAPGTKPVYGWREMERFRVPDDEGYDSESMDAPRLTNLAVQKYESTATELAAVPLDPALIYSRQMFGMLQAVLTDPDRKADDYSYHTFNYKELMGERLKMVEYFEEILRAKEAGERVRGWRGTIEELKERIQKVKQHVTVFMPFIDYIVAHTTRVGMDFAADDGQLYDIHNHPMDAATTRDSLEGYLEQFIRMSDSDKEKGVPCYHKPTPAVRGQPEPVTNCTQNISMKEIETIVSYEFFKRFSAPQPFKAGLNIVMPVYEAALPNTKALEEGYGDEYHETMCPFCLQTMSRGEGCSYMTHENPKRLGTEHAPFCQKEFVVQSILDKYTAMAKQIDGEEMPLHLEVCVECGRPCSRHQHFDITSAEPRLVRALTKPDPAHPGRFIADYATCAGGGRTELFARMLAVRDVYKKSGIKNPKEEREVAAKAADAAAKDPAYLARGKAIADMPPAERKFNTKVPAIKKYDDPAYEDVSEEEAAAAAAAAVNAVENAAVAARVAAAPSAKIVYPERFPEYLRKKLETWLANRDIEPIDPASLPDIEKFTIAQDIGLNPDQNAARIRDLGDHQVYETKQSREYKLWKQTDFRANRIAYNTTYANVVFHYWRGFVTKARIAMLTVEEIVGLVMRARERRARDRGEAVPAGGIIFPEGTLESWKREIHDKATAEDPAEFRSDPIRIGTDIVLPLIRGLTISDAEKILILDDLNEANDFVRQSSQWAIYVRLKTEERRRPPPPHPANLKIAKHQINADCVILYISNVRELLAAKGFPNAIVPENAVLEPRLEIPVAAAPAANVAPAAPAANAAPAAVEEAAAAREALPLGNGAPVAVANAAVANAAVANAAVANAAAANGQEGIALRHLFNANENAAANAAPAAQLPVIYPADNTLVARDRIRQGLADPPLRRDNPLIHMYTWILEVDVTFGDAIDDVLSNVAEGVKQTQAYRSWKEVDDAIRAGGPIPNNYDQLWVAVCLKYTEVYLAQVAAVQQGGRNVRKNRTYKRRGLAFTRSKRSVGSKTYKKRKVHRKTRRN